MESSGALAGLTASSATDLVVYTGRRKPMPEDLSSLHASERAHHDAFYTQAVETGFFERVGFQHLVAWNLAALRRAVPVGKTTRILSIGCGLGDYERLLAPHVAHIVAVDLSPVAIEVATRRAAEAGVRNVEFRCAAGIDNVVAPGSVDLVIAFGVFHHLSVGERRAILHQAHDWLAPGGWIYVRDPSARGVLRRTLGPLLRWWSAVHTDEEEALDPYVIAAELRAAGFDEPRLDYVDVIGGPLPWLVASPSPWLWRAAFGFDRLWLATPARRWASQFAAAAQRVTS